MPIYEYRCLACGEIMEIFQGMGHKDNLLICKYCGGKELERILSPASFSFKGAVSEDGRQRCCDRGVSCDTPKRCCEN